jgi:predicted enzyme involved in methoxymalonyl-ACP biosynthesis
VEDALWAAMLNRAHQRKVRRLEAEYLPTAKNTIVAQLYDRLGLQRIKHDACVTRYALEPLVSVEPPAWIVSKNGAYG